MFIGAQCLGRRLAAPVRMHHLPTRAFVLFASVTALVALPRCAPVEDESSARAKSPLVNGSYVGCYTDDASRALPVRIGTGYDTQRCVDEARARGLPYAGLQYYGECWGGTNV